MSQIRIVCTDDEDMPADALEVRVVDMWAPHDLGGRRGYQVMVRLTVPSPHPYEPDRDDLTLVFDNPVDAATVLARWNEELNRVIEAQAGVGGDAA